MRIISIIVGIIILITYFFPQLGIIGTVDCYERSVKQYMTNSFYHANLMHLAFNMFALYQLSIHMPRCMTIQNTYLWSL